MKIKTSVKAHSAWDVESLTLTSEGRPLAATLPDRLLSVGEPAPWCGKSTESPGSSPTASCAALPEPQQPQEEPHQEPPQAQQAAQALSPVNDRFLCTGLLTGLGVVLKLLLSHLEEHQASVDVYGLMHIYIYIWYPPPGILRCLAIFDILAVKMHAKHTFQLLKIRLQKGTPF